MNDKEWEQFFELLEKIVDLEMSVGEKVALVKSKANENGETAEMNLEEFAAWDFE